jgi:hypothetical protein
MEICAVGTVVCNLIVQLMTSWLSDFKYRRLLLAHFYNVRLLAQIHLSINGTVLVVWFLT